MAYIPYTVAEYTIMLPISPATEMPEYVDVNNVAIPFDINLYKFPTIYITNMQVATITDCTSLINDTDEYPNCLVTLTNGQQLRVFNLTANDVQGELFPQE